MLYKVYIEKKVYFLGCSSLGAPVGGEVPGLIPDNSDNKSSIVGGSDSRRIRGVFPGRNLDDEPDRVVDFHELRSASLAF